ncbi:MAG: hypothetical protein DRJ52_04995 [Thermoprotei archaeon]|nr:MAG: hypothetical protein DRJ52_04995 [Thermoprotei archaeon]
MVKGNPFSKIKLMPGSGDDIFKIALNRAKRMETKSPVRWSSAKRSITVTQNYIKTLHENIVKRIKESIYSVPKIDELDDFYRELAYVVVNMDDFKKSMGKVMACIKILDKLRQEYLIKSRRIVDVKDAKKLRREYTGRVYSVVKSINEELIRIREYQKILKKLPSIDPSLPTIVIAGVPNVGKSTLVNAISSARSEVASYPFTTKKLTIGHIRLEPENILIQVIDTPGLLDRPLSERNKMELQAILALKHLIGIIVYMIDPSETCGFTINYQFKVLSEISTYFKDKEIVIAINKIDIFDNKGPSIQHILKDLENKSYQKIFLISALKKISIDYLKEYLVSTIRYDVLKSTK